MSLGRREFAAARGWVAGIGRRRRAAGRGPRRPRACWRRAVGLGRARRGRRCGRLRTRSDASAALRRPRPAPARRRMRRPRRPDAGAAPTAGPPAAAAAPRSTARRRRRRPRHRRPRPPTRWPACATPSAAPATADRRAPAARRCAAPDAAGGSLRLDVPTRRSRSASVLLVALARGRLQLRRDDPAGADAGRLPGHGDRVHQARRRARPRRLGRRRLRRQGAGARPRSRSMPPGSTSRPRSGSTCTSSTTGDAFERLRATIDDCARSFVTDPETYESLEQSPFVMAGQGPWGSRAVRRREHRCLAPIGPPDRRSAREAYGRRAGIVREAGGQLGEPASVRRRDVDWIRSGSGGRPRRPAAPAPGAR